MFLEKLRLQVFGKNLSMEQKKDFQTYLEDLAKPKDKWKVGKQLLELKKKFPHDMVLQKMIEEEFKANRVFKFPEEYDIYDEDEDTLCKHGGNKSMKKEDLASGKLLRERFKTLDGQEMYYTKKDVMDAKRHEKELETFIIQQV